MLEIDKYCKQIDENQFQLAHIVNELLYLAKQLQDELEVQPDKARNDALEEAAEVCDDLDASYEGIAQKCAVAIRIRALKKDRELVVRVNSVF